MELRKAYLVDAVRTPLGRGHPDKGALRDVRGDELAAHVISALVQRQGLDPASIDDVILGCVAQFGETGKNLGRLAVLLAGLPESVPGMTVNRLCGSSLQAICDAALRIETGRADLMIAGGVEHMGHLPMTAHLDYHPELFRRHSPDFTNMGKTAEHLAELHGVSRKEQDAYALASNRKALDAAASGRFDAAMVPVRAAGVEIARDQGPRDSSAEQLAALGTPFREGGTVTAASSSGFADGAAACLLASADKVEKLGLSPLAEFVDFRVVGLPPMEMGLGPIPALRGLLDGNRLRTEDVDLYEINEAFAVQVLLCRDGLGIPDERLNVNGGALALGHPLGCSGARIAGSLAHEMALRRSRYGVAAMCIGHGQGIAALFSGVES